MAFENTFDREVMVAVGDVEMPAAGNHTLLRFSARLGCSFPAC